MPASSPTRAARPARILTKLLITLAVLATLLVGLAGWALWTAATAKPVGMATDYATEWERVVADAQPEGTDAWPDILVASNLIDQLRADARAAIEREHAGDDDYTNLWADYNALIDTSWQAGLDAPDPDDRAEAAEYQRTALLAERVLTAAESSDLLPTLDAIAAAPRAVRRVVVEGPLINVLLPELGKMRDIARLNNVRAHRAALAGDWAQATRSIEHNLALARHSRAQATLIEHLVGVAIESITLARIEAWSRDGILTPSAAEALAQAIDRQAPYTTIADAINNERIWSKDMIQWTHTAGGRPVPSAVATYTGNPADMGPLKGLPPAIANLASFVMPSATETTQALDDAYNAAVEDARKARTDRTLTSETYDQLVDANSLTKIMVPAVGHASRSGDLAAAQRNLARTALAIELYRATTGTLPESLADLNDPNAPTFTHDPITADQPLQYRIDPTRPAGYLLYSIGLDTTDNNGTPAPRRHDPDTPGDIVWAHPDHTN